MAKKSNLHSLIIKSNRTIPETISDMTFRSIYRAVKDIIDYWSDITISLDVRLIYKRKYIDPDAVDVSTGDHVGDDFIDITGSIAVSNVYLAELLYVCFHVNGNKDNMQGKLKISEGGLNYYVLLADTNMHNNFIETIAYDKFSKDGITLYDIATAAHSWIDYKSGSNNENLPLCGNYVNRLLPYTNPKEDETNRKNFLNNLPDKYLFNDVNNVDKIQVYDFTPYYNVFGEYMQRPSTNEYGYNLGNYNVRLYFILPFLWSCITELGDETKRPQNISEMWFFIPAKYSASISMLALIMGNKQCPIFDFVSSKALKEESKKFSNDSNRTTIDRLFIKCRHFGGYSSIPYMTTSHLANVTHLCLDLCGKNKYIDPNGIANDFREIIVNPTSFVTEENETFWVHGAIKVTNIILLFSGRYKPPVTFSMDAEGDAAAYAWLTNPLNIRWLDKPNNNEADGYEKRMTPTIYYTASDPEVLNGTAQEGDVKEASFECYNMYAFMPNGNYWYDKEKFGYVTSIFVPDEWYYFFKYSYYVYDKDGVSRNEPAYNQGRIEIGVESPKDVTPVNNINTSKLYSFSDYKHEFNDNIHYNPETGKFWWQTNTVMNTIISSKEFRDTDDPHRWFAV